MFYLIHSESAEPFDLFNYGINIFEDRDFTDDFEDKLRHFGEECDYLQGFQFIVDAYNGILRIFMFMILKLAIKNNIILGFGGASQKSLELIHEEFNKKPIFAFLPFPYFDDQVI